MITVLRCKKAEICLIAFWNTPLVLGSVMGPWLCVFCFISHILPNDAMWILLPVLTGAVNSADVFKEQSALIPNPFAVSWDCVALLVL